MASSVSATQTRLAALGALLPRPGKAGIDALLNHGALELGEDAAHLKHRLTQQRPCVDATRLSAAGKRSGASIKNNGGPT
jgi:hypothetical protein